MRFFPSVFLLLISFAATAAPSIETSAKQAVLIDATTGTILLDKKADERMPTSSMSKMMTMYVVFDALKQGKIKPDTMVVVSEHAWKAEGSRMFIDVGSQVKVEDLMQGVIVQSGNDASVALAEAVSGSETSFADRMNEAAAKLGMTGSHFMNATGLPHPEHYSTPHDLAKLALAIIRDFPEHYHFYSQQEFTYNKIKQGNRNPLLYRSMGVDGLKTGHAEEAGYGLTASASRDGRRLVLVVNGMSSMQERADESARLLEWGYREFRNYTLAKKDERITNAKIWLGVQQEVPLASAQDIVATLPVSARQDMQVAVEFQEPIMAPVLKDQPVGKIIITVPGEKPIESSLVATADVPKLGFFAALLAKAEHLFGS